MVLTCQRFAFAKKFDAEMIQFIKHVQEVSDVPRDAVKRSNERTSKRCGRASAKNWSSPGRLDFAPENYVAVLLHDFASAQFGHFAQVVKLCFEVLVSSAYAGVNGGSFLHFNSFFRESK